MMMNTAAATKRLYVFLLPTFPSEACTAQYTVYEILDKNNWIRRFWVETIIGLSFYYICIIFSFFCIYLCTTMKFIYFIDKTILQFIRWICCFFHLTPQETFDHNSTLKHCVPFDQLLCLLMQLLEYWSLKCSRQKFEKSKHRAKVNQVRLNTYVKWKWHHLISLDLRWKYYFLSLLLKALQRMYHTNYVLFGWCSCISLCVYVCFVDALNTCCSL